MRALVWLGPGKIVLEDVPAPVAGPGEAVVDVVGASICGSDLHAYRENGGSRTPPLVLGHEAVGTVAGRSGTFAILPLEGCGSCQQCLAGLENLCSKRKLLGLDRAGVFAEQVIVRESCLIPLPPDLPVSVGVLAEPLATAIAALRAVEDALADGGRLVIIGCGSIGLLALVAVKTTYGQEADVEVTVVDPVASRRELAYQLGASTLHESVSELSSGAADAAIDAVGVEETWSAAIRSLRPGGAVAIVGLGSIGGHMDVGRIVRAGITLKGTYAYSHRDFLSATQLLPAAFIPAGLTTTKPLSNGQAAFDMLIKHPEATVKVVLDPSC